MFYMVVSWNRVSYCFSSVVDVDGEVIGKTSTIDPECFFEVVSLYEDAVCCVVGEEIFTRCDVFHVVNLWLSCGE